MKSEIIKKKNIGEILCSDFKDCYTVITSKAVWHWPKNTYWLTGEDRKSRNDQHVHAELTTDEDDKTHKVQ